MSYIYFVSPVASDPNYNAKRAALAEVEKETGQKFFFPLEERDSFSLQATKEDLARAFLVLADLSLERPSCYFEVGLAQAVGTQVVLIAVTGTILHQAGATSSVRSYADLAEYRAVVRQIASSVSKQREPP
ncbi:MAG TPA: hypothetical protein VK642_05815 [Burkholderiales bacterium]|nr:hypothetical protein [Burkholderiales bacterium]